MKTNGGDMSNMCAGERAREQRHPGVGHVGCQHRVYDLTCDEMDALIDHADAACQLCRLAAPDTPQGKLHIDHDARRGPWAVRGLLCSPCNTSLERWPLPPTPAQLAYLAAPWIDLANGSRVTPEAEPPIGTTVSCGHSRRLWTRADVGWWPAPGHGGMVFSWERLNHIYAPHRIKPVDMDSPPKMHWLIEADVRRLRGRGEVAR